MVTEHDAPWPEHSRASTAWRRCSRAMALLTSPAVNAISTDASTSTLGTKTASARSAVSSWSNVCCPTASAASASLFTIDSAAVAGIRSCTCTPKPIGTAGGGGFGGGLGGGGGGSGGDGGGGEGGGAKVTSKLPMTPPHGSNGPAVQGTNLIMMTTFGHWLSWVRGKAQSRAAMQSGGPTRRMTACCRCGSYVTEPVMSWRRPAKVSSLFLYARVA